MQTREDTHLTRLSVASILVLGAILAATATPMSPHSDPDVWWHLATGDRILDTGSIPTTDPFSWYAAGKDWVAHEWLSEVIFAGIRDLAGAAGLLVLAGLTMGLAFVFLRRAMMRVAGNEWIVFIGLLITFFLSENYFTIRPHLFSFLLLAIFLDVLIAHSQGGASRWVWVLVPLTAVWANLHGQFVVGPALIWIFGLVGLVTKRAGARTILVVALAATVVAFANPAGPAIYLYPFHVAQVSGPVSEWQPAGLRDLRGAVFIVSMLAALISLAMFGARRYPALLAATAAFSLLGLGAAKNMGIAAVPVCTALAAGLAGWGRIPAPRLVTDERERRLQIALCGLAVAGAVYFAVGHIAGKSESELLAENSEPKAAMEFVGNLPPGRVMNHYNWGGYMIWKLDRPVGMDGRNDMYGRELLNDYLQLHSLSPGWRDFLEENDVRYVLWPRDQALTEALRLLPDEWKLIYEDGEAVVYRRT